MWAYWLRCSVSQCRGGGLILVHCHGLHGRVAHHLKGLGGGHILVKAGLKPWPHVATNFLKVKVDKRTVSNIIALSHLYLAL